MATVEEEIPKSSKHEGGCHCGATRFTVTLIPPLHEQNVVCCNCSICTQNGYLLVYPLDKDIVWHQEGYDRLSQYAFGSHKVIHRFCPTCGTSVCIKSVDSNFLPDKTIVNVRTFTDVDTDKLQIVKMDGRSIKLDALP